jgi:excisionase family DNA binding protein
MNNPFEVIEARLNNIETLLLDIKHLPIEQDKQPQKDELLTVQDTAKFLSLSVPTVYGLISKGELPVMKRSKRCYFSKVELINYLKEGRKKTIGETAKEAEQYLKNKKG